MSATATGYSGTPLAKKLGIKENCRVAVQQAPPEYLQWLTPLPPGVQFDEQVSTATDIVHLFSHTRASLQAELQRLRDVIRADTAIWVSWPKKASKVATDISEDSIRELALPLGLVDIKVCAVNEVWSGLKLVIRKTLR